MFSCPVLTAVEENYVPSPLPRKRRSKSMRKENLLSFDHWLLLQVPFLTSAPSLHAIDPAFPTS